MIWQEKGCVEKAHVENMSSVALFLNMRSKFFLFHFLIALSNIKKLLFCIA